MTSTPSSETGAVGGRAILALSSEWQAGPDLPESVTRHLYDLQQAGLVERDFRDMRAPEYTGSADELTVRLSGCWHFRLTDAGLAAGAALASAEAGK